MKAPTNQFSLDTQAAMEKKNFGSWSCQSFLKLCYISAYSFNQVIKNIFFKTGFVIDNKPPLEKENNYA